MSKYEQERLANIAKNRAMLEAMGISSPLAQKQKQVAIKRKPNKTKKRVVPQDDAVSDTADDDRERPNKVQKVEDDSGNVSALRRSSRNKGKAHDYNDNGASAAAAARSLPRVVSARASIQGEPRNTSIRKHDPKTYGAIPGVPVGSWWETRAACSQDAIHAPWVAGISSGPEGAYSVALSGGYEDDVDLGDAFTFTGSGGRDLHGTKSNPKNLRTAPQSADQSFQTSLNAALLRSSETKKPVRVIRGFKLDSPYAPAEGYRYDGLYTVEKAWMEKGLNAHGYKVCKFALKRIPGQAPLQVASDDDSDEGSAATDAQKESDEVVPDASTQA